MVKMSEYTAIDNLLNIPTESDGEITIDPITTLLDKLTVDNTLISEESIKRVFGGNTDQVSGFIKEVISLASNMDVDTEVFEVD